MFMTGTARKFNLILSLILGFSLLFILGCDEDDPEDLKDAEVIVINEICAKNAGILQDETGDYDDWVELYNASDSDIDIGGYWLSDESTNPIKWKVPEGVPLITTIQAGEYLVLWADDEEDEGVLHMSFSLRGTGESIGFADRDGDVLDQVVFGPQNDDITYGRFPNGSNTWRYLDPPTPGAANVNQASNRPPLIENVEQTPEYVLPDEKVNIRSNITDESSIASVSIFYKLDDGEFQETEMSLEYGFTYVGEIPGQEDGTLVEFYVSATDDGGLSISSPLYAPTSLYSYEVLEFEGDRVLFINELQAVNGQTITDEEGEYEDWIEIHNASNEAFDIGGLFITDDLTDPFAHQISDSNPEVTTIPAGGFLILWADDDTDQGILHLPFKLSASGESIGLWQVSGELSELLDGVNYPEIQEDESYGRSHDGGSEWMIFSTPTPGFGN